jgi:hypothetical protein
VHYLQEASRRQDLKLMNSSVEQFVAFFLFENEQFVVTIGRVHGSIMNKIIRSSTNFSTPAYNWVSGSL